MSTVAEQNVAIIAIGRNEGERLKSCLRAAVRDAATVLYVDSGSTDGSADFARSLNCHVLELDPSRPFTAARARNEGFACLMGHAPDLPFIQFLDGDCDLMEGWIQKGLEALTQRPDVGIVSGQVRELYPQRTIYNKLCDLEWQQPAGEVRSSGGRFMIRTEVFSAARGFRADVIAAEDDEFCVRVRQLGWKILLLDAPMARHDIAMTRFGEWWRRATRTGHAFAQVAALHGGGEERYFVKDCRRIWVWALLLPLLALCLALFTHGISLIVLLCAYCLQFARNFRYGRQRGWGIGDACVHAFFTMIFKFPALLGLLEYHRRQRRGTAFTIIEYK
ncbi:MAG: glycosyltransferase [Silvibacterium sp.]|nr:glycosyltransferase [Silvibacterium sp.]